MKTETKIVKDKTFEIIKTTVNKMVDMIRPTYGPASNKVIIDKKSWAMVVDDGVQIARDFSLNDPIENAIVKLVRETAVRTNDRVGDGTTCSLIMLQAIINEIGRRTKIDGRKIELELKKALEEVKEQLLASKKEITTKEELKKVAMVSFDDDKVAEILADLYFKLGKDAIITVEKSQTMDTHFELSEGVQITNGYISPYMVTNPERMETEFKDPLILITDYRLTEANDILPIMNKAIEANKRELVIICENMEQSALATAIVNKSKGVFLTLAICHPKVKDSDVYLSDLALMTGAKFFSVAKGDRLEEATVEDMGTARKFICRREESVIVNPGEDKDRVVVAASVTALRSAIEVEKNEKTKKEMEKRLSFFTNSMASIKVGAATENEQKALKYKVEDAVNSVKAAFNNGVVCGGGLALKRLKTSSGLLNEALTYPARQLRENMGLDDDVVLEGNLAYNVVTQETGDFMEVGVIDPVDVLVAGVESAVSIASILVTSSGMLVEHDVEV